MCDRCKSIRVLMETKVNEVIDHFASQGDTREFHIAQILRDDPMADAVALRKAFTSVGPNFHVAMQAARVAVEKVYEAHNFDLISTSEALIGLVARVQAERTSLLQMETHSDRSPTRPM